MGLYTGTGFGRRCARAPIGSRWRPPRDRDGRELAAGGGGAGHPGLAFRRLRLPDDLAPLSEMHNRACEADDLDERESPRSGRRGSPTRRASTRWPTAWSARSTAGSWPTRRHAARTTTAAATTSPAARWTQSRGRGSGAPCCAQHPPPAERARREDGGGSGPEIERRLESWAFESQAPFAPAGLEGFEVVRWFFEMLRPNLDDIADMPMPDGWSSGRSSRAPPPHLGSRHRGVRDHWGASEESEERSALLRSAGVPAGAVARGWDGDEVAGWS